MILVTDSLDRFAQSLRFRSQRQLTNPFIVVKLGQFDIKLLIVKLSFSEKLIKPIVSKLSQFVINELSVPIIDILFGTIISISEISVPLND